MTLRERLALNLLGLGSIKYYDEIRADDGNMTWAGWLGNMLHDKYGCEMCWEQAADNGIPAK